MSFLKSGYQASVEHFNLNDLINEASLPAYGHVNFIRQWASSRVDHCERWTVDA